MGYLSIFWSMFFCNGALHSLLLFPKSNSYSKLLVYLVQNFRSDDRFNYVSSVTSSETTNITVCVLAKQLGAKRTVARISNTEFLENKDEIGFKRFGIDELISPEALAAKEIKLLLDQQVLVLMD